MKDLEKLFASLVKSYGTNGVYKLDEIPDYGIVSTGSLSVDYSLGIGGLPLGRVIEIGGAEGSGKTMLCLHLIENYLQAFPDKIVAFIDMEHRLEKNWAANFVTDMGRVLVLKPSSAEEGINAYRDLAESDMLSLVIWDSIGGSPTAAEMEKDAHKGQFGGNSKIITTFAKFAATLSGKHNFTTIGINQIRDDISGYRRYVVPGGKAWLHACSIRIQLKRAPKGADGEMFEKINGEEIPVGYKAFAKIIKSSVGAPGKVGSFWFYNVPNSRGFGIDKIEEVVRLSTLTDVVERRGAWHYHETFPDGKLQGAAKFADFLRANPDVSELLFQATMARMKSGTVDLSSEITQEDPDISLEDSHPAVDMATGRPALSLADIAAKAQAARAEQA